MRTIALQITGMEMMEKILTTITKDLVNKITLRRCQMLEGDLAEARAGEIQGANHLAVAEEATQEEEDHNHDHKNQTLNHETTEPTRTAM